jgi:uncharacterized protein (DUF1499 family)
VSALRLWEVMALGLLALPLAVLAAGQAGLLAGPATATRPGLTLAPIDESRDNAVSSLSTSAAHRIDPIALRGEPRAAFARLADQAAALPGVRVVERTASHLRAECESRWFRFIDDLDLVLDAPSGVAHVRSAARLGRRDFGVNRARVEALRRAHESQPGE